MQGKKFSYIHCYETRNVWKEKWAPVTQEPKACQGSSVLKVKHPSIQEFVVWAKCCINPVSYRASDQKVTSGAVKSHICAPPSRQIPITFQKCKCATCNKSTYYNDTSILKFTIPISSNNKICPHKRPANTITPGKVLP